MKLSVVCLAAALSLAACAQEERAPVDSEDDPASIADGEVLRPAEPSLADATLDGPTRRMAVVPERFRGVWDTAESGCEPNSLMRLEIGERVVHFYESRGEVTDVESTGDGAIVVSLAMEGEGDKWTMKRRLTLSADGATLTQHAAEGEQAFDPVPLTRCANRTA